MIQAHLAARASAPVWLYWGVRDRGQLYLDEAFRALAAKHPRFSYIPVLSDAEDGAYRHGFIGPAVAADFDTLAGYSIYMAGPKAMIDATLPLLEQNGAEMDYVFCDAFSV